MERGPLSDRQKGDLLRVPFVNQNDQTAHLFVKGVPDTPASVSSASGGSSSSSTSVGTTSKKEMEITIIKSKENSDKSSSQDSKEERRHLASSKITLSGSKKSDKFKFKFMFGRNDTREIPDLEGLPGGQRPGAWPGPPATCRTTSRGTSLGSSCGGGLSPTGLSILNFGEAAGGPVKGEARRDHYPYNQFLK